MQTNDVLKELKSLIEDPDWHGQISQRAHIRFKGPKDKQHRRNPLAALALHLHGKTNPEWLWAGATLGLDEDQVHDFNLASETYWYRPQLRRQLLEACGFVDKTFEQLYLFMEKLIGKSKLPKVLESLSSEDRIALEYLAAKPDLKKVEEIVRKY